MSGIEAINKLTEKYKHQNKTLRIRHLSPDSVTLLNNASSIIEVNIIEDPQYKVMIDKI